MCGWESVIPYMVDDMHTSWKALSVQQERVQRGLFPWLFKIFSGEGEDNRTGFARHSDLNCANTSCFFVLQRGIQWLLHLLWTNKAEERKCVGMLLKKTQISSSPPFSLFLSLPYVLTSQLQLIRAAGP